MARSPIQDLLAVKPVPYQAASRAPDGRHVVVTTSSEWRNSLWVDHGAIHRADGSLVAELGEAEWHVDGTTWSDDGRIVTLAMRRFPGDAPGVVVTVDLASASAGIAGVEAALPLSHLGERLERYYRDAVASRPPGG